MASALNEYFNDTGRLDYEDENWFAYLRDTIGSGVSSLHAHLVEVDISKARRYNFDFFTYLRDLGIKSQDFWTHVIVNGWKHPTEFCEHTKSILVIPSETIEMWYIKFREVEDRRQEL